jgi:hypothetical protein
MTTREGFDIRCSCPMTKIDKEVDRLTYVNSNETFAYRDDRSIFLKKRFRKINRCRLAVEKKCMTITEDLFLKH